MASSSEFSTAASIGAGKLMFFNYRAKYRATLPYYDRVPLIYVLGIGAGMGFIGHNFHYHAPESRPGLIQQLLEMVDNDDDKFMEFLLTGKGVHKYLATEVSQLRLVKKTAWEDVSVMPLEDFVVHRNGVDVPIRARGKVY
ncbi:MAG: hypothetical protein CBD72_05715 [Flavobacteriaceae bacterium TMED212]|nr:MAG: hypothetical protein CBC22_00110 [Alphaproteobacteria bacterium TMED62]OUW75737.1 MAG: hypothetical protein CBD72_05715 [Flavobacteriaceae bacterium TMED212]